MFNLLVLIASVQKGKKTVPKSGTAGKAARLTSEPCATIFKYVAAAAVIGFREDIFYHLQSAALAPRAY